MDFTTQTVSPTCCTTGVACVPTAHILQCGHIRHFSHPVVCNRSCNSPAYGAKGPAHYSCRKCKILQDEDALVLELSEIDKLWEIHGHLRSSYGNGERVERFEDMIQARELKLQSLICPPVWQRYRALGRGEFERELSERYYGGATSQATEENGEDEAEEDLDDALYRLVNPEDSESTGSSTVRASESPARMEAERMSTRRAQLWRELEFRIADMNWAAEEIRQYNRSTLSQASQGIVGGPATSSIPATPALPALTTTTPTISPSTISLASPARAQLFARRASLVCKALGAEGAEGYREQSAHEVSRCTVIPGMSHLISVAMIRFQSGLTDMTLEQLFELIEALTEVYPPILPSQPPGVSLTIPQQAANILALSDSDLPNRFQDQLMLSLVQGIDLPSVQETISRAMARSETILSNRTLRQMYELHFAAREALRRERDQVYGRNNTLQSSVGRAASREPAPLSYILHSSLFSNPVHQTAHAQVQTSSESSDSRARDPLLARVQSAANDPAIQEIIDQAMDLIGFPLIFESRLGGTPSTLWVSLTEAPDLSSEQHRNGGSTPQADIWEILYDAQEPLADLTRDRLVELHASALAFLTEDWDEQMADGTRDVGDNSGEPQTMEEIQGLMVHIVSLLGPSSTPQSQTPDPAEAFLASHTFPDNPARTAAYLRAYIMSQVRRASRLATRLGNTTTLTQYFRSRLLLSNLEQLGRLRRFVDTSIDGMTEEWRLNSSRRSARGGRRNLRGRRGAANRRERSPRRDSAEM